MEDKIIKSGIFENKIVLSESSEQPIDVDFTLPEYYPDISKILKCCCTARISSKGINGTVVTCEGTATITVIYIDSDNMLNGYEYSYPFSKNFDAPSVSGRACLCVTAKTDYINCRAVTARKIDIHGAVSVSAVVTEKEPMEIISDVDLDDVEVLRQTVMANTPVSCNEKSISIEENIEIGSGLKDINCLIRYSGEVSINEGKLIAGKAMIKGELNVNLLYCNDDGDIASLKESLPFSQMMEVELTGDNCGIDTNATLAALDIRPKSNAEGKTRSFDVNAKVLICVDTYCNSEISVVTDAYSRKYETAIEKKETTFTRIADTVKENFNVKQTLETENIGISKVIDIWCTVKPGISKFQDNRFVYDGSLCVSVIVNDKDGTPAFFEREIPYSFGKDESYGTEDLYTEPEVTVNLCTYSLLGNGNMEIRAELTVNAAIYECERKTVLVDISVDSGKPAKRPDDCAMMVYFASKGESLWEISSRYLADTDEIKQINEISEDILQNDTMILVPIS